MSFEPMRSRRKTVTRTFRINESWDKTLRLEAKRQGVSANSLVNHILKAYSDIWRYVQRYKGVTMWPGTLSAIVALASEDELAEAGKKLGETVPKQLLQIFGRPTNWEGVVWYLKEGLGAVNWFVVEHYVEDTKHFFHFYHDLGMKWSIFVKNYLNYMLRALVDYKAKFEVSSSFVAFEARF